MRILFLLIAFIALTYACTKETFNGQCYYCCGSISFNNNVCTCNDQSCQTCSTVKNNTNLESGRHLVYFGNTSYQSCPNICGFQSPSELCYAVIVCDSNIHETPRLYYNGQFHPYFWCDYHAPIFGSLKYKVYFCPDSECQSSVGPITFENGCGEPQGINYGYCDSYTQWVMAYTC